VQPGRARSCSDRPVLQTGDMALHVVGLLAHQGGWDEALMVAAPIVLIGGLLVFANRRAKQALARRADEENEIRR